MVKIVERYPPRHNLQLIRYDSAAPFECWRCRKTKVSRLQAVVSLERPRIICNGCYGYLLSLAEIKAQDVEPWVKTEQIHDLNLKEISAKLAAQAAEKQERRSKQYWKFLSDEAKRFIGTAEHMYELMSSSNDLDFSPLVVELVRTYEYECVKGFIEPLRTKAAGTSFAESDVLKDCQDRDLARMASYVLGRVVKPPELGTIAHTLSILIHNRKRVQESGFLQILDAHISSSRNSDYFLNPDKFVAQVQLLTQSFRNPAAHTGSLSKRAYEECREIVIGPSGALWQLLAATR